MLCALWITIAFAQTTGQLRVSVVDAAEDPVADVSVTLIGGPLRQEQRHVTDEPHGQVLFTQLPPGRYDLRAEPVGLAASELHAVRVLISRTTPVTVRVSPTACPPVVWQPGVLGGGLSLVDVERVLGTRQCAGRPGQWTSLHARDMKRRRSGPFQRWLNGAGGPPLPFGLDRVQPEALPLAYPPPGLRGRTAPHAPDLPTSHRSYHLTPGLTMGPPVRVVSQTPTHLRFQFDDGPYRLVLWQARAAFLGVVQASTTSLDGSVDLAAGEVVERLAHTDRGVRVGRRTEDLYLETWLPPDALGEVFAGPVPSPRAEPAPRPRRIASNSVLRSGPQGPGLGVAGVDLGGRVERTTPAGHQVLLQDGGATVRAWVDTDALTGARGPHTCEALPVQAIQPLARGTSWLIRPQARLRERPGGPVLGVVQTEHWVDVRRREAGFAGLEIRSRFGTLLVWVDASDLVEGVDEHRGPDCRTVRHLPQR